MNLGLQNAQKIYLGDQEVNKIILQNIEVFFPTSDIIIPENENASDQ